MASPDFAHDPRLSSSARLVGEELQKITRRCYTDCLVSAKSLAQKLSLSVRTVQSAIKALAHLGLVEVIRDYGLRTRRRIRLLWRVMTGMPVVPSGPPLAPDPSVSANTAVECQIEFALTDPSPPFPPYKVSEDTTEGGRTDEPGAGNPAYGHPAPAEPEPSSSPTLRSLPPEDEEPEPEKVAPEAIAELIEVAAPVLGTGPATEGKVREMARKYAPAWIRKALGITARKGRKIENPIGYTFGVLEKFAAEGVPASGPTPARAEAPSVERKAQVRARYAARLRGGGAP